MLAPPTSAAVAGVASIVIAALLVGLGYLLADAVMGRRTGDPILRLGLAVPALTAYVLVLMVLHMWTGGRVLRAGWPTVALTLAVAAVLVFFKIRRWRAARLAPPGPRRPVVAALVCAAVGVALWGAPVFARLPLAWGGDVPWNVGFASEILNGDTTPSSNTVGDTPNQYPWLYHADLAFAAHFAPGGRAFDGLETIEVLQIVGSILALFAIGRELTGSLVGAGAAAVFGAMSGGFGFFAVRGIHVTSSRAADALKYFGDLIQVRPYNVSFSNLSPPFPRDLALLMLLAFLVQVAYGLRHSDRRFLIGAGVSLGMAGLAGAESFIVGVFIALAIVVLPTAVGRLRKAVAIFVPAGLVYSLWLVPLAASFIRLHGFVNITKVEGVELPAWAILGSWGIATIFGAYGFARLAPKVKSDSGAQVVIAALAGAGIVLLISTFAIRGLGESFLALGRRHRYWPLLDLGVVLAAAYGAADLFRRLWERRRALAVALSVVTLGFAFPSPTIASLAVAGRDPEIPLLAASLRGDPQSILNVVSPKLGRGCWAASEDVLIHELFSYAGYRVLFDARRIRWQGFHGGRTARERANARRLLITGETDVATWESIVRRYGIDLVIAAPEAAATPPFQGRPFVSGVGNDGKPYIAVWVGDCRH
jgi:hypothetical protein